MYPHARKGRTVPLDDEKSRQSTLLLNSAVLLNLHCCNKMLHPATTRCIIRAPAERESRMRPPCRKPFVRRGGGSRSGTPRGSGSGTWARENTLRALLPRRSHRVFPNGVRGASSIPPFHAARSAYGDAVGEGCGAPPRIRMVRPCSRNGRRATQFGGGGHHVGRVVSASALPGAPPRPRPLLPGSSSAFGGGV